MERAVCIVPGCCNSSATWAGYRYICGPHWRMIPKTLKRRDRALIRFLRKYGEVQGEKAVTERARGVLWVSWVRLEHAAIQAAAGL